MPATSAAPRFGSSTPEPTGASRRAPTNADRIAAAIGGRGPLTSAAEAATALEPVVGPAARSLFAIGLLGAAVALAPGNLISLLINTQIINGLIAPIFLTFLVILASRPSVLGTAVNTPRFRAAAIVCVSLVGILAVIAAATTIASWMG